MNQKGSMLIQWFLLLLSCLLKKFLLELFPLLLPLFFFLLSLLFENLSFNILTSVTNIFVYAILCLVFLFSKTRFLENVPLGLAFVDNLGREEAPYNFQFIINSNLLNIMVIKVNAFRTPAAFKITILILN